MVGKKGFHTTNWSELNNSDVKVAVDIGSVHEIAARRFARKATIIAFKARDDCILAVQSGRADCVILAVNLGLTAVKKNPALHEFQMLHQPRAIADLNGRAHGGRQTRARIPQCLG